MVKTVSETKEKMMHPSSRDSKVVLRRSLRLRLKALGTSLDIRSSRKLSQLKPETYLHTYLPSEKPKGKVVKRKRNMKTKMQLKKTSISKQGDTKHQGRIPRIGNITSMFKQSDTKHQRRVPEKVKMRKQSDTKNLRRGFKNGKPGKTYENKYLSKGKKIVPTNQSRSSRLRKNRSTMSSTSGKARVSKGHTFADLESPEIHERTKAMKMKAIPLNSFTTERHDYAKREITRFCDVAFLDDKHILALDDNFIKETFGHRICCFSLEGTLLCELPLPAHPWSLVVKNPTEVVVSLRDTPSHGLLMLTVDISSRSIEIVKNVPLENDCFGLAFNGDIFAVSYHKKQYISLFNSKPEEIGRIPVAEGAHYRCQFINNPDSFIYLDYFTDLIKCMNLDGKELFTLKGHKFHNPIALSNDIYGHLYVGTYNEGNIAQFDEKGEYLGHVLDTNISFLLSMAINRRSDLMAISHENFISLYKLTKEDDTK